MQMHLHLQTGAWADICRDLPHDRLPLGGV